MTQLLNDEKERQRALDPRLSFIVQAPAGSGKTELLTQRYLVLLSTVKQPEEILSITFTKKSAGEMRARIIRALTRATNEPEPILSHDKKTWLLAKKVLEQNLKLGWNLLENPNRMQIQTIDSLNSSLTRQLPLLSRFGAQLEIIDDPRIIYDEAVEELLSHLEENVPWASSLEKLLIHMDNNLENVKKLLISMLAKRDQWLPYIASNLNNPELRATLENYLQEINLETLQQLNKLFPLELENQLIDLISFATQHLQNKNSEIKICADLKKLPGTLIEDKKYWLGIYKFLIKEDGDWRKQVNINLGFPASDKKSPDKELYSSKKKSMTDLLQELSQRDDLNSIFADLHSLPSDKYEDLQWEVLYALHDILRVAVAQLKIIFQKYSKIDYIENAQAALMSLGTEEEPTDLTLFLDYKIHHILVDEFQDTSSSQYQLLVKLISGWEPNDGRTVFLVGDPMQSIYRFREAEVGLFIRARRQGIGHLSLVPLTLSCNFRSTPTIVNWVNQHFHHVFPKEENISQGAVCFTPSVAAKENALESNVQLHACKNKSNDQVEQIIKLIHEIKTKQTENKIVILVRTRTQLQSILPALKNSDLNFRALDIEKLAQRPVVQDLLALTRALFFLNDRIAWLAILRAPWCGLSLKDLWLIANDQSKPIIWEQLTSATIFHKISEEGQLRLKRIIPHLQLALSERNRYSSRDWVEQTWYLLGGPACVVKASDLIDAEAYLNLLAKLDENTHFNLQLLHDAIDKLYAAPNNSADDSLQIMTIHNAKGLEFDTVILPCLERIPSRDDNQILQWIERPRTQDKSALIIAPIQAVGENPHSIYEFIKRQHKIKLDHEYSRLLYVAVTRAKKSLHLFFDVECDEQTIKNPRTDSLLHKLWSSIQAEISAPAQSVSSNTSAENAIFPLRRLAADWVSPFIENKFVKNLNFHQTKQGFELLETTARSVGTVIHRILQMIALNNITWWHNQSNELKKMYITQQLRLLNVSNQHAVNNVQQAIDNTLEDARGQWILKSRSEMHTEFALTANINGCVKQLVIDRTFVDENDVRWIIDYKSSVPDGDDLEIFLQQEKKLYEVQLQEYAEAMKAIDKREIRFGLYFPRIGGWCEWV